MVHRIFWLKTMRQQSINWKWNIFVVGSTILFRIGEAFVLPVRHFPASLIDNNCHEFTTIQRCRSMRSMSNIFDVLGADIFKNELISQEFWTTLFGNMKIEDVVKIVFPLALACYVVATQVPDRLVDEPFLRNIVQNTFLERNINKLTCVYKATKDGWSAMNFHEKVDGKGSGIVVARSLTGRIFGGYNANGWRSTDDYYSSTASFLWYKNSNKVIKLPILPGGDAAVFDYATSGPCFGASDLLIGPPRAAIMGGFAGPDAEDLSNSAGSLRQCRSSVGSTYKGDFGWPARGSFPLFEVEVYCIEQ